jgi:hypothetical protein
VAHQDKWSNLYSHTSNLACGYNNISSKKRGFGLVSCHWKRLHSSQALSSRSNRNFVLTIILNLPDLTHHVLRHVLPPRWAARSNGRPSRVLQWHVGCPTHKVLPCVREPRHGERGEESNLALTQRLRPQYERDERRDEVFRRHVVLLFFSATEMSNSWSCGCCAAGS